MLVLEVSAKKLRCQYIICIIMTDSVNCCTKLKLLCVFLLEVVLACAELLLESLNTTGSVYKLLLARIERMAH